MRLFTLVLVAAMTFGVVLSEGSAYAADSSDGSVFGYTVRTNMLNSGYASNPSVYLVDTNSETCMLFFHDAMAPVDCKKLGRKIPELAAKMTWINWDKPTAEAAPAQND